MKTKTFRRALSLFLCAALVVSMFTMSFSAYAVASGITQEGDLTIYDWDFTDKENGSDYAGEMDADSVKFDAKGGKYANLYGYNAEVGAYEIDTMADKVTYQTRGYVLNNPAYTLPQSFTVVGGGLADYLDQFYRPGVIFAADENGYYGFIASYKMGLFFSTVHYYSYVNGSETSVSMKSSGMNALYISSVNDVPVEGQVRELEKLTDKVVKHTNQLANLFKWKYQVDVDDNGDIIVVPTAIYDDGTNEYTFEGEAFTFNIDVLKSYTNIGATISACESHIKFGPRFGFYSIPDKAKDHYASDANANDQSNQATQIYSVYAEYLDAGDTCFHETTETVGAEDATCEDIGYTGDVVCADCEEVLKEGEIIDALGHAWKETEREDATTEKDGYYTHVCTRCELSETVKLDKLDAYVVTFLGEGGTVLDEQTVGDGLAATAPETPESAFGYEFIGWDTAFDEVRSNLTVSAVFFDPDEYAAGYDFDFTVPETAVTDTLVMEHLRDKNTINGTYNAETGTYVINTPDNSNYVYVDIQNPLHTNLVSSTLEGGYGNTPGIIFAEDENGYYMYRLSYNIMTIRRHIVYIKKDGKGQNLWLTDVLDGQGNAKFALVTAIDGSELSTPTTSYSKKQPDIGYEGINGGGNLTAEQLANFSSVKYTTMVDGDEIVISTVVTYDDAAGTCHEFTLHDEVFSLEIFTDPNASYVETNYQKELATVSHDGFHYMLGYAMTKNTETGLDNTTNIKSMSAEYEEYDIDNCRHDERDWETDGYYYDCIEGGETGTTSCSYCGAELSVSETIAPKGYHLWKLVSETAEGKFYECMNCDATDVEASCTHAETELKNAKAASCTQDGYTGDTVCKNCGVTVTKGSAIKATGHTANGEGVVTAPTCTDKGYTTYTCATCSQSYTGNETAALGHDLKTTTVDATCTAKGSETTECSRCDLSETKEIEALGHDYKVETVAAACTAKGSETTTCSRCDYNNVVELDMLDHTPGEWLTDDEPTTETSGSAHTECTVCGEKLTKTLDPLPKGKYGDYDNDGDVDITDAIFVARCASYISEVPEERTTLLDVNGDGLVNICDAVLIAHYSAELITKFPVEA